MNQKEIVNMPFQDYKATAVAAQDKTSRGKSKMSGCNSTGSLKKMKTEAPWLVSGIKE